MNIDGMFRTAWFPHQATLRGNRATPLAVALQLARENRGSYLEIEGVAYLQALFFFILGSQCFSAPGKIDVLTY